MVFGSLTFLYFFLPAALVCYHILPKRAIGARNIVLLLFSLGFYCYGEPRMVVLLLASIGMNYGFGRWVHVKHQKLILCLCIALNLGALLVFKYLDFLIGAVNTLLRLHLPLPELSMPIGISFYTFQAMSYVIDVSRGKVPPQKNILLLALYVSMFPQLVAGPIVRYGDLAAQLTERDVSFSQIGRGVPRFVLGLSKKVLLANTLAKIADGVFSYAPAALSSAAAWLGAIAYMLQIYFDFSGYSDMAIGLGRMFGFSFPENFDHPYRSRSITEFWRCWHMSLSAWFRDYVYIPLGGNHCTTQKHIRNLLIVWTLTGLWHGANYTLLAWGLYFGLLLIAEKYWLKELLAKLPPVIAHAYALLAVLIGWVLFRSDSLSYALAFLRAMVSFSIPVNAFVWEYLIRFGWAVLIGTVCTLVRAPSLRRPGICKFAAPPVLAGALLLCTMALLADGYNPFLYFRF